MDHHYHHHQQQWRPRPLPGNICPTCSASHFPFCPPHPSFYQSPRFPFDPYRGPTGPPLPFTDGFGDPRPWVRNPSLDSGEPYGQFQSESYSNGFVNESDRNPKKPRIDDIQRNQNAVRMSFEDERRLKLIREHGSVLGGLLPEGVAGTMPGMNRGMNGDVQESSAFDVNYGRPGVGEFGKFDGSRESMSELGPIGPRNMEFYDPRFGSGDRRGQPNRQSSRNGFQNAELSHSRHGRDESSLHSFQTYGIKNVDQTHLPYPVSEVPADNYLNTHNPRQWQISDSMPANEPPYSHTTNWQGTRLPHPERRDSVPKDNRDSNSQLQHPYGIQYPGDLRHDSHSSGLPSDARQPLEDSFPSRDGKQGPIWHQSMSGVTQHGAPNFNEHGGYFQLASGGSMPFENTGQMEASRFYNRKPPVPASPPPLPPPPPPTYPALRPSSELIAFVSPPKTTASLFPVPVGSLSKVPSSYPPIPEAHSLTMPYASTGFLSEAMGDGKPFPLKQLSTDKPKVVDASQLFKPPHRATRPDHIVIILRGLPGSGKSYLAKMLRDLEVENGGHAPRIHSIDDYFMTEVEKVEEGDIAKSSISVRGKKPIKKKVMEYCYEPEMEEAYRSSMLKAFKKTLEEGVFTFIIVDDRNLRVADFAQFWAFAKSSGYEVYILEATYKDPVGCAARNVHGFTKDNIEKMARQWEEAPCLYLQLDVKSLFHGDDLKESGIQEVEMDMEDGDFDGNLSELTERKPENIAAPPVKEDSPDDSLKDGNRWDSEGGHPREEVKEIGRSKWSADLDGDLTERTEGVKGNINALSGLIQAYAKEAKSVRWADQVGSTGFSIHAAKKANVSLVIGPGAGYNLKSNPIPEEEIPAPTRDASESKRQSVFQERLRAERESFKVVFDRRRQRIGRLDLEEE